MSLFSFGKKKREETKKPVCACNGSCATSEATEIGKVSNCCSEAKDGICCIKVLGAGCASCHALYENTQAAVRTMKLPVEVEYITDLQKVMEYGVMSVPALVVNEKVISAGKVLKAGDIQALLEKLGF